MIIKPEIIKSLRVKNNLTQENMAEKLKISRAKYMYIENNPMTMKVSTMVALTDIFNCELAELFE